MSESLTLRVNRTTHDLLKEIASESGETLTAIVDEAVKDLRKKRFWDAYDRASEALKADPVAWNEYQREIAEWDCTLSDGLEPEHDAREGRGLVRRLRSRRGT